MKQARGLIFIYGLFFGTIGGAAVTEMYNYKINKKVLDIMEKDVLQLYQSFKQCHVINEELLETFTKRNKLEK